MKLHHLSAMVLVVCPFLALGFTHPHTHTHQHTNPHTQASSFVSRDVRRRPFIVSATSQDPEPVQADSEAVVADPNPSPKKDFKGFGKPREAAPQKKGKKLNKKATEQTELTPEFKEAAKRYDSLAKKGVPEYAIYIRKKGATDREWFCAGAMCVPRSDSVDQYIYATEQQLLEGAFRMASSLKGAEEYEYGYNLARYPDEPIKVATRPQTSTNLVSQFVNVASKFTSPIDTSEVAK